nr:hypothetical protein [Tanacetum cinerariifolium]
MPIACDVIACVSITDIRSVLTQRALRIFYETFHIPDEICFLLSETKVRIDERKHDEDEPKLLETTVGRVVLLLPVSPDCSFSELEASEDKLFDEGGSGEQANHGDSASSGHGDGITTRKFHQSNTVYNSSMV